MEAQSPSLPPENGRRSSLTIENGSGTISKRPTIGDDVDQQGFHCLNDFCSLRRQQVFLRYFGERVNEVRVGLLAQIFGDLRQR
jgi:hypothetical protein